MLFATALLAMPCVWAAAEVRPATDGATALFASARACAASASWECAADLALRALASADTRQRAEYAAYAVEWSAAASRREAAREALARGREAASGNIQALLLLDEAQVRLLGMENQWQESLALAQRIAPELAANFGPDSEAALTNAVRWSAAQVHLGQLGEALARLDEATAFLATRLAPGHPARLLALSVRQLASCYAGMNEPALAAARSELAEARSAFGEDDRRTVDATEDLLRIQGYLGRDEDALALAVRVYLWRFDHLGADNPQTVDAEYGLGHLYGSLGRYRAARGLLADALDRFARSEGIDSLRYMETLDNLGSAADSDGDHVAAIAMLERLATAAAARFGDASIYTQGAQIDLGLALLHDGQVERAAEMLRDVLRRIVDARPGDAFQRGLAADGLGRALIARGAAGDLDEAVQLLRGAWETFSEREGDTSWHALQPLSVLATAHLRRGDEREARELLRLFVERTERARASAAAGSLTRESAFAHWISEESDNAGYRTLAYLEARAGDFDASLRASELSRDRALRDRFADMRWRDAPLRASDRARLEALRTDILRIEALLARERDHVSLVRLDSERLRLISQRGELEERLQPRGTATSGAREGIAAAADALPTIAALRASIPDRTALVSIGRAGAHWWGLVLTRRAAPRLVELDADPGLAVAARTWGLRLRGEPARAWPIPGGGLREGYARPDLAVGGYLSTERLAARLGEALLEPLAHAAGDASHLVLVVDDVLVGLPFEALPLSGGPAVQRLDFTYAPSFSTYIHRHVAGRPDPSTATMLAIAASSGGAVSLAAGDLELAPLPHAQMEARHVAARFAGRATVLAGAGATKQAFMTASASGALVRYSYIHLALHAVADPIQPQRSAIVFAEDPSADRVLTAAELAGLDLHADLLTLSGCETGVGAFEPGQGLLGLAFAALGAGNRAAVLSLWPVADDATERFMDRFYGALRAGRAPAQALAQAKRASLRSANPADRLPGAWAAFVLYGAR